MRVWEWGEFFLGAMRGPWNLEVIHSQKCFSETRASAAHWDGPFLEEPRGTCQWTAADRVPPRVFLPSLAQWCGSVCS